MLNWVKEEQRRGQCCQELLQGRPEVSIGFNSRNTTGDLGRQDDSC